MPSWCLACTQREKKLYVRDNFVGNEDLTIGLTHVRGDYFACPSCGARYFRGRTEATFFHDYDEYSFIKLEKRERPVVRCPKCGSTATQTDEARSRDGLRCLECTTCGFVELANETQQAEWTVSVSLYPGDEVPVNIPPPPVRLGCERCAGDDEAQAWQATQAARTGTFVQESHFSVHRSQCSCGQAFITVFTERVDWKDGEDDQRWLVLAVTNDELARLKADDALSATIEQLGQRRRFLERAFPTGKDITLTWRAGALRIGPHD